MKTKIDTYRDSINYYYSHLSHDNEYEIIDENLSDDPISVHASLLSVEEEHLVEHIVPYIGGTNSKMIVNQKAVDRFHPNKIKNNLFWKYAKERFPLFSVCGGLVHSIDECNSVLADFHRNVGLLSYLENLINKSEYKLNILEIGYGHGSVFNLINNKTNYIGIDYSKSSHLKKFKNLLTIQKSGIPKKIENNSLDVVYCVNVLQHCSQKDRFDYLRQAYDKLKPGGIFIGSSLLVTTSNCTNPVWGIEDLQGRKYCNFLKQLTEVDTDYELGQLISDLNFNIEYINLVGVQHLSFILKK